MQGRGRNSPHRRQKKISAKREGPKESDDPEADRDPSVRSVEEELHPGPAPRICMDYFYTSSQGAEGRGGASTLSTKELRERLRDMGSPIIELDRYFSRDTRCTVRGRMIPMRASVTRTMEIGRLHVRLTTP